MLADKEKFNEYLLDFFKNDVDKAIIDITKEFAKLNGGYDDKELYELLKDSKVTIVNENSDTIIIFMNDPYVKITIDEDNLYSIKLRDQMHTVLSFETGEIEEFILYWNRFIIDHFNYGPNICLPKMHFNTCE